MTIPIVSLFSGCGGLDLGFAQEQFETVAAFDIDPAAVKTYNLYRRSEIAEVADLASVGGSDIIGVLNRKDLAEPPRGVIGGSPCQTFSEGNRHFNGDDIRHTLPGEYAAILKILNQQYDLDFFVFENVRGITYTKHRNDFGRFKGLFEDAGFNLFEDLLDAIDFGVPQRRPRVFVVGFNKQKYDGWSFKFPEPDGTPVKTVADAIQTLPEPRLFERGLRPEDIPYHPNHWAMKPTSEKFRNNILAEGQSKGRSFRVLSWNQPSWTVAYGHREVHIHPSGKRRLSVYEAMLLQGFPPDYQLCGTLSDQIRQVSDAVPPPLGRALARSIRLFLEGDERTRVPRVHPESIESST